MKKFITLAALGGASLALAACGSSDDASSDLDAENVEVVADEALDGVTDEPVADDGANAAEVEEPTAVSTEAATEAAERAEDVAAQAEEAAAAADAIGDLDVE